MRLGLLLLIPIGLLPAETFQLRDGSRVEAVSYAVDGRTVFLTTSYDTRIVEMDEIAQWPAKPVAAKAAPVAAVGPEGGGSAVGVGQVHRMLDDAAERHGLPAELLHAVAATESGHNPMARSHKGAFGVMQLMPATARHYGADPAVPAENIDAGTRFLRELLLKYEHHPDQLALALAAYNAGPGAVAHFGGVPPYKETQSYVRKAIQKYKSAVR